MPRVTRGGRQAQVSRRFGTRSPSPAACSHAATPRPPRPGPRFGHGRLACPVRATTDAVVNPALPLHDPAIVLPCRPTFGRLCGHSPSDRPPQNRSMSAPALAPLSLTRRGHMHLCTIRRFVFGLFEPGLASFWGDSEPATTRAPDECECCSLYLYRGVYGRSPRRPAVAGADARAIAEQINNFKVNPPTGRHACTRLHTLS